MKYNSEIPHIELLIFDLDGTLIDSSLDLILSVNATLRHLGRDELDAPTIQSYIGRGAPELIQRATGGNASEEDRKSTRLNSSHVSESRMPSSA